jgi:putative molybdopterin biosynthesis protein
LLAEELLAQAGVLPERIEGWDRTEPSHAAVAQAVASGAADAGLAIEAAASARGLDFVPLVQEMYYLVCLRSALEEPPMLALRGLLRTRQWQDRLAQLPGYEAFRSGEVLSLRQQLGWWHYRQAKQSAS